jgi:hypothetical protein
VEKRVEHSSSCTERSWNVREVGRQGVGVDGFTHLGHGGIHKDTTRNRWLLLIFDIKIA